MSQSFFRNGTVLLINDDVNARIIERTLLEERGLPVRAVGDGYAACDLLVREGLRVAVMVVNLEINATGMNGWQLLRRLRDRFEGMLLSVQPRTVVTTLRQDPQTARVVTQLGADAVLQRPVAPRAFIDTVERLRDDTPAVLVAPSHLACVVGTNDSQR